MTRPSPTNRDRWVTAPHGVPHHRKVDTSRGPQSVQVFHNDDGDPSSTATIFIEDEYDPSPIDTGLLNEHGDAICRIPWQDTLPVGFHYKANQYDEEGYFIGNEEE